MLVSTVNPAVMPLVMHTLLKNSLCCRSKAPSAFTGYSFHVLEAVIVFANEIIIGFLVPIDLGLHRVYHLFTTLIHQGTLSIWAVHGSGCGIFRQAHSVMQANHAGGHSGYEISPFLPHLSNFLVCLFQGLKHGCKGFNTVRHHDMHHQHPSKHFSLYFTHWDRACGTLHPRYDAAVMAFDTKQDVKTS